MVSRKKISGGVAVLATIAVALAGCSASSGSGSTDDAGGGKSPFIVYASLGLTGPVAGAAAANVASMKAAAQTINKDGGIGGRKIDIVVADDALDPAKATTLLQEQLDKAKPDLVIAGSTSNVGLALAPILTREKIMSSGQQTALADGTKYPYHFGMFVPNSVQVSALVSKIESDVKPKKVAILHANDSNGQAVDAAYEAAFKEDGVTTVAQQFAPTDVDMTAQLQALQAEKPDALVVQGFGSVAGYTLQSRTKLGWNIPTYGHADYGSIDLSRISGPGDWKNLKILTYYPLDPSTTRTAGYQEMLDGLKSENVTIDQPISQYALFWDLMFVAKKAWESAKGSDAKSISAAWLALNIKASKDSPYTFMPTYRFDKATHNFDIKASDAMRIVDPAPIVNGIYSK